MGARRYEINLWIRGWIIVYKSESEAGADVGVFKNPFETLKGGSRHSFQTKVHSGRRTVCNEFWKQCPWISVCMDLKAEKLVKDFYLTWDPLFTYFQWGQFRINQFDGKVTWCSKWKRHENIKEVDLNLIINYYGCKLYLVSPKGKAEWSNNINPLRPCLWKEFHLLLPSGRWKLFQRNSWCWSIATFLCGCGARLVIQQPQKTVEK